MLAGGGFARRQVGVRGRRRFEPRIQSRVEWEVEGLEAAWGDAEADAVPTPHAVGMPDPCIKSMRDMWPLEAASGEYRRTESGDRGGRSRSQCSTNVLWLQSPKGGICIQGGQIRNERERRKSDKPSGGSGALVVGERAVWSHNLTTEENVFIH